MNAKFLFPLTAAAIVAASAVVASISSFAAPPVATKIVDLPTITVRPAAEDLAYFQAHKIVDLAAVTVRPEPEDLAYYLASRSVRIVNLPVVTVRPDAEGVQLAATGSMLANHVATR